MPQNQKAYVLIVDDDALLRGLIQANVKCYLHPEHEVSIYLAESVPDFRSQFEGVLTWADSLDSIDHIVLITDYQLGDGGTGTDIIASLYELLPDDYHAKVTIALTSGLRKTDAEIGALLLRYPQVTYINKPDNLKMLQELLRELNLHRDIPVS